MKLSLRDLERLRKDPRSYGETGGVFPGFSKNRALQLAVYRYHRERCDLFRALAYFEEAYRSHFKRTEDIYRWLNDLVEYDAAYKAGNYATFRVCMRTTIVGGGVELTGEIPRLDMDRSGEREYAVWILTRRPEAWRDELRMPLIQAHIAGMMHVTSDLVSVGVYDFETGTYDRECFGVPEIARARDELARLVIEIAHLGP